MMLIRKRFVVVVAAVVVTVFVAQPAWALVFGGTTTDRLDRIEQQTTAILNKLNATPPPVTVVADTTVPAPVSTMATPVTTTASTVAPDTTVAPGTTVAAVPGVLFAEPFNTAGSVANVSTKVHAAPNFFSGLTFQADHDTACGSTMTTRTLTDSASVPEHVYWCAGHLMTAMNTTGYVSITLSPKDPATGRARVFPSSANRVCWDQTLTDMGGRKWIQLAVISEARFTANGFKEAYIRPGFEDVAAEPSSATLGGDDFMFVGTSSYEFFRGQTSVSTDWGYNEVHGVTNKMVRYRTCVTDNRNGTVTRTQARPDGTVNTITDTGAFPAGPHIVVLEDESYHPDKAWQDEGFVRVVQDGYSWHWDNITVEETT